VQVPREPPLHLLVALLVVALAACSVVRPAVEDIENLDAANGPALYRRYCASCHGTGGHGDGPVAEHLKVRLPDLTLLAATHGGRFPRDEVVAVLTGERSVPSHGPLSMPVWGQPLSPGRDDSLAAAAATAAAFDRARDVTAIADFLASIQRQK
jgi:mono/diheme cytochrome c family protein